MLQRRHLRGIPSSALLVVGLLVAALALVVVPSGTATAGPAAASDHKDDFDLPEDCAQPGKIIPQVPHGCRLTRFRKGRPTVMVWGDSHAWQHLPALLPLSRYYKVNLTVFTLGGCPPVHWPYKGQDQRHYPQICHQSNALALRYAKKMVRGPQPFYVIVGSHWAGFRDHYRRIFDQGQTPTCKEAKPYVMEMSKLAHARTDKLFHTLRRVGIRTVAAAQPATVPPLTNAGPCAERDEPYVGKLKRKVSIVHEGRTRTWLRNRMSGIPGSPDLVDINGAYCGPRWCKGYKNDIYTWYDDLHISATRVRTRIPRWRPIFQNLRR